MDVKRTLQTQSPSHRQSRSAEPQLQISRSALIHNIRLIRGELHPGTKICAMVKANAYGHGADVIVDALCNFEYIPNSPPPRPSPGVPGEVETAPMVEQLAVGSLDEADTLIETSLPVLVLRAVENVYIGQHRHAIEHALRNGWTLTIGTGSAADDVARIAIAIQKRANVHVMLDSGMTRCGCAVEHLPELLGRIEGHSALRLVSLGTHLATSEVTGSSFVPQQFARFRAATDEFVAQRGGKIIRHVANSGGIFFWPKTHLDMVRPGISIYGIDPTCKPNFNRPLRPVAKWTAPIISILDAAKGATVGYGQTWRAPRDTRIGLIPVGYADGYQRAWSNQAMMLVHRTPVPVVGRVSMDLTTIDLHDVPAAQIGDEVTIMDNDPLSPASPYALAELGQTIPYEVFTRIGSRVKRVAVE
jgi:alanine racemase